MDDRPGRSTPRALERAAEQHIAANPEDRDVLDRLMRYVELGRPMMAEIMAAVCELYSVEPLELKGRYREAETAHARQLFCYMCRRYTRFSLAQIGWQVGLDNHTSVLHAVRKIEKLSVTQALVADDISLLHLRISEKILQRAIQFGRA